ncbi:MAG TPA: thiamine pyrophosphate-dependent enzyme [Acidimicrobiales bacterium]|nr:thiamine pyrophosphate-dependent enzyme [Acidimicrobiales bacterium]
MEDRQTSDLSAIEVPANPVTERIPVYVSDRIADLLHDLGYRYLPLNPGSSFRGLHDSVVNYGGNVDPKVILCLHEEIAVAVAHGYAKASGNPAAAAIHDLVGLMHASMAVFDAWADGVPLLVLGGSGPELPRERRSLDWTHSASTQSDLVSDFTKWTANPIDESGTLEAIAQAHRFSRSAPMAPAYVTVDAEVQERLIAGNAPGAPDVRPIPKLAAAEFEVERAARLLLAAEFPLVTAGRAGLYRDVTEPLVRLCELLGAAYREDQSFVSFPSNHDLNLTGDPTAIEEADVILAVDVVDPGIAMGSYAESRGAAAGRRNAKLIDISQNGLMPSSWCYMNNAAIEREVELVADPVVGLTQVLGVIERLVSAGEDPYAADRARRRELIGNRHDQIFASAREKLEANRENVPISAGRMVQAVWSAVKDLPWILALRNTRSWPLGVWEFTGAGEYMGHSGGAGVGYGPGAMVGVALAAQENGKVAIAIIGDGDLVMAANAIWTAVHYHLPLLVVVNNNSSFYNDELHQYMVAGIRGREPDNAWIGTRYENPNVDFAVVARGYGASAMGPIEDPSELDDAMSWAVKEVRDGRVAVVDVRVERDRK